MATMEVTGELGLGATEEVADVLRRLAGGSMSNGDGSMSHGDGSMSHGDRTQCRVSEPASARALLPGRVPRTRRTYPGGVWLAGAGGRGTSRTRTSESTAAKPTPMTVISTRTTARCATGPNLPAP